MSFLSLVFGVLLILSSIGVVFAKNPLNSAFSLVVSLFIVAVHFVLMNSTFLATIQVLVYAGAIMVLIIFVLMLIGNRTSPTSSFKRLVLYATIFFAFFFNLFVYFVYLAGIKSTDLDSSVNDFGTISFVGRILFNKYSLMFELVSLLIISALVGATILALEKKRSLPKGRGLLAVNKEND